jgi:glucan phosphoethanolaminetransferase (alkaline phosphatase superfamily)
MINTILGMSFGGVVNLVISCIVFYYIFVFVFLLIGSTVIAIYMRDWQELKKIIGYYFLTAFGVFNAIAVLGIIVAISFQKQFVQNGIELKSLLIIFIVCFVIGLLFCKIGNWLINSVDSEYYKDHAKEKESQKLVEMFGRLEWLQLQRNDTLRKEILNKLRNKEKIDKLNYADYLYK